MKPPTLRLLLLCLVLGLLLPSGAVWAQPPVALETLTISLWPEFDRAQVLVILDGTLAAEVALPASVTLRIPAASGGPHAVAVRDEGGNLLDTPSTVTPDGSSLAVTLQASFPNFRVEYYDPALTFEGDRRGFTFQWKADFPVRSAAVSVQEPAGASDLAFDPALEPSGLGPFGLNYHSLSLGPLTAGQTVALQLSYSKPDSTLSASTVGEPVPLPDLPDAKSQPSLFSPWLENGLVVGVLLLAGGGLGWYWYSTHPAETEPRTAGRHRRGRRAYNAQPDTDAEEGSAGFCTQCGEPHQLGDRFCRKCGAALRE